MTEDELLLLDRIGPTLLGIKHLDEELRSMMLPGAPRGGEGGGGKPGSKPPVPAHLLDLVVEAWEKTRSWSANLMADVWGAQIQGLDTRAWMCQRHSTAQGYCNWLYRYRELIVGRSWAVDILDELEEVHDRMADALPKAEPEPVREVPDRVRQQVLAASDVARLTGIPVGTIRRWGTNGEVPTTATARKTKLYRIGDVLDRHQHR